MYAVLKTLLIVVIETSAVLKAKSNKYNITNCELATVQSHWNCHKGDPLKVLSWLNWFAPHSGSRQCFVLASVKKIIYMQDYRKLPSQLTRAYTAQSGASASNTNEKQNGPRWVPDKIVKTIKQNRAAVQSVTWCSLGFNSDHWKPLDVQSNLPEIKQKELIIKILLKTNNTHIPSTYQGNGTMLQYTWLLTTQDYSYLQAHD